MGIIPKQRQFLFVVFLCDVAAIILSVIAAYVFRFYSGLIHLHWDRPDFIEYMYALIVVIPVYMYFFRAYGLYKATRHIRRIEELFLVGKAVTFSVIVLMACTFFYRRFSYSRVTLTILWIFSIIIINASRYFLIQWEYRRKVQRKEIARLLLVGANRNTRSIVQWARNNPHYGREIVGILARESKLVGKHFEGSPVIGSTRECEKFIQELKCDEVILVDNSFSRDAITDLVSFCEDRMVEFRIGADFYGLMTRNVDVEYISTVPLLGFRSLPVDDPWNRFVKKMFDFIISVILILVTMPLWLLVMLCIKLSDGGPIFYKQERVGRDQKVFTLLKFRTMKIDAERETGPVWTKPQDSRRTLIGNFLRRWNIDELPQLFNVLIGNMSLVGPRPERPHFVKQFRESIPRYMARHKIKSGLTGWAQVNGYRGNTSIHERIKYDLYYMENWSLMFDIEILLMTFFAFKNAY